MITEGEWLAKDGQVYIQETGETIAILITRPTVEEQLADERLISAAPELLKAVKGLLDFVSEQGEGCKEGWEEEFRQAEDAVQKATEL